MRKVLYLLFAVVTTMCFYSCFEKKEKEPEKELTKEEIEAESYSYADDELEGSEEKIALLSFVKNMPKDSVKIIVREYLKESCMYTPNEETISYEKCILKVATKCSVSPKKVASIIFSYTYEMLTRDEIRDEIRDEEL